MTHWTLQSFLAGHVTLPWMVVGSSLCQLKKSDKCKRKCECIYNIVTKNRNCTTVLFTQSHRRHLTAIPAAPVCLQQCLCMNDELWPAASIYTRWSLQLWIWRKILWIASCCEACESKHSLTHYSGSILSVIFTCLIIFISPVFYAYRQS